MITTKTEKLQQTTTKRQKNKQASRKKRNNRNRLCNKQTYICKVLIQGNEQVGKRLLLCLQNRWKQWNIIKGFIQHRYYGSIFTSFLLHSLSKKIGKCSKGIYGY